jgi:hypothetical protein
MLAMRWVALGVTLAGCLHGKSHPCTGDDGVSWVCPDDKACAAAPVYCGTADEVGACDGKMERDPCATMLVPDGQCVSGQCTACSNDIAGCRYVGWNPMTSANATRLAGVAFTGFGEAYAVGDSGTLLRYDTSRWDVDPRFPTLPTVNLISVVNTGTLVYVLADNQTVYVLDQGMWRSLPTVAKAYTAMWATDTEVFLVGTSGAFAMYNGTSWNEIVVGTAGMRAVWGTSATNVYAVGAAVGASAIAHYDGTSWTPVAVPNVGTLSAVWGTDSEVFATATTGTQLLHATSGTFAIQPLPISIAAHAVWGSAVDDVFVVGSTGMIVHWDGVSWTQFETAFQTDMFAVTGSSSAEVLAVGDSGAIERYTGLGWAEVGPQPTGVSRLRDIWVAAPNEAFAVGNANDPTIFHWTNGGWQSESAPSITASLVAVWGRSNSDVLAVGQLAGAHRGATSAWTNVSSAMIGLPVATWGNASTTYAVGEQIAAFDGATWTTLTTGNDLSLDGVWVAPSNTVRVAGAMGVAHLEGTAIVTDVAGKTFTSIWGSGESDVYAVGPGDIHHFDGSAWTSMTIPTSASLAGVWGRGVDDVFAVGAAATTLHYHAGVWKMLTSPFSDDFTSVSGAGDSIYVTTADGKVYMLLETAL